MKTFVLLFIISVLFFLLACKKSTTDIEQLVKEWNRKEIIFPERVVFTKLGHDTVAYETSNSQYRIITYIDSSGCTSCRMQLDRWKNVIAEFDSVTSHSVPILFFIFPKNKSDIQFMLKYKKFDYPVCLDLDNSLGKLNKFPLQEKYQTFLLDKDNKVILIGNPTYNYKIKELYLEFLSRQKRDMSK